VRARAATLETKPKTVGCCRAPSARRPKDPRERAARAGDRADPPSRCAHRAVSTPWCTRAGAFAFRGPAPAAPKTG